MPITPWPSALIRTHNRFTSSKSSSGPRENSTPIVTFFGQRHAIGRHDNGNCSASRISNTPAAITAVNSPRL